ncbi:hypothetical protein O6H91_16G085300 [Diphasiastrum complanatum]|uniref:Uncharacterized protein n=1 Tax=Diphasiastrum complanatum TaxID=34168 RepID=A0ACC2BFH7_DIPCM|nr:hypothetical protein O6H91_16G085300 [Diphasiastrum complanatum]
MNEHAIIKMSLKDYLFNSHTMCKCNDDVFFKALIEDKRKIGDVMTKRAKYGKSSLVPIGSSSVRKSYLCGKQYSNLSSSLSSLCFVLQFQLKMFTQIYVLVIRCRRSMKMKYLPK